MKTNIPFFLCLPCLFITALIAAQNPPQTIENEDIACPPPIPAIALAVPDAFGKGHLGALNLGGTLQSRTRLSGDTFDPDGNISIGLGLGDPERAVGAELRTNIYGLLNERGAPGNFGEGTLDLHLGRKLPGGIWLGAGVFDLTGWNREEPNQLYSIYAVVTRAFRLREKGIFNQIYLTAGVGNGRFRSNENFNVEKESGIGVMGSLATPVLPRANFILEWKGYNVVSGLAFYPVKKWPAQLVVGMNDLAHENRSLLLAGSLTVHLFRPAGKICWKNLGLTGPPPPQPSRI